jgi:ABC-type bacteriocin/lantibiotic exporter with double-glycine peptidase domain
MFGFPVLFLAGYFQIRLLSGRAQENKKSIEESGRIAAESVDNIDTVANLGIERQFCSRYENLLSGPFRYTRSQEAYAVK